MVLHMFFSYNLGKIKMDSGDVLSLEKMLTLHNAIIHIKSVLNKDQNNCYYNMLVSSP